MTLSSPPEPIGYMSELGVERTLWTPGASRLELTLTEDHLNKGGVAHGGIHMILLDSALGSALVASLKVEEWCATLGTESFLAAARPVNAWWRRAQVRRGENVAHPREIKVGERYRQCDGDLGHLVESAASLSSIEVLCGQYGDTVIIRRTSRKRKQSENGRN